MKKVAIVFVLAVFVPSLVLAWLAVRSLRDQQFLLERQQSLLYQGIADDTAKQIQDVLANDQHEFVSRVGALLRDREPRQAAKSFDELLHQDWPLAQVGFVVTSTGEILSPSRAGRPEASAFYAMNDRFLANRETAEVYRNVKGGNWAFANNAGTYNTVGQPAAPAANPSPVPEQQSAANPAAQSGGMGGQSHRAEEQNPAPVAPQNTMNLQSAPNQLDAQQLQAVPNASPSQTVLPNQSAMAPARQNDSARLNSAPAANEQRFGGNGSALLGNGQGFNVWVATNAQGMAFAGTNDINGTLAMGSPGSKVSLRSVNPQFQAQSRSASINNVRSMDGSVQSKAPNVYNAGLSQTNVLNNYNQDYNQGYQLKTGAAATNAPAQNLIPRQQLEMNSTNSLLNSLNVANDFYYVNLNPQQVQDAGQLAQQASSFQNGSTPDNNLQYSKVAASEAEFRQLIGDDNEGTLARFVENRLSVLFWCRAPRDPELIFGASLALPRLVEDLKPLLEQPDLQGEICVALLDDSAKPVALSHPGFHASWKRPLVATEIGESLPHWEVAVYPLDPHKLTKSAQTLKLTLGLLIGVLVLAIGVGSWLIVSDLSRQLTLARQKTDFVSNVSHELKTPLTSIRMFSELLAEGRVKDAARQLSYLNIITSETARLTRLINNVLDFARMERGEKKYHFQKCDVAGVVFDTAQSYRPHLETNGFKLECALPESPVYVNGDRDALAQVVVNLLSNAEKYSDGCKEVAVSVSEQTAPLPHVEVRVLDRGLGVPAGCGEKIFEKFYRAHDSLSSGIQGSGLGLTLARQIARAHGGEVAYEPRAGGGSCFILRLPLLPAEQGGKPKPDPGDSD